MSKLVLVLNCGSSSLKFAIVDAQTGDEHLSGLAECLHLPEARIKWKLDGKHEAQLGEGAAHKEALSFIVETILASKPELAENLGAIGHRVVHGGEQFTQSALITDDVLKGIENAASFAPLHNPAHLVGIEAAKAAFPNLKNVAVFDTAFHQTMPEEAYLYALPYKMYKEHGIRRYGMHGTSHYFIAQEAAARLGKPVEELNIINCHLGNGASVCAIKNGKSVDTSMGMTPLEGLVMGTRSGDLDPAIIFHLHDALGYSVEQINNMLTKESGLMGLTEVTSDCRFVEDNYGSKEEATRAMDVFCHRLAKYVAGYTACLDGRLDAIVFTGGIGENSGPIREQVLNRLGLLGVEVDQERNLKARFGGEGVITTDSSRVPAMVISTNEELVIAQDTARLAEI
ncbi:acetate kinase [Grimontia hollisae]|uniref:Acetate kinase n=2 Tax=Grimontia hollisae TaxID=673 RepID=D0I7C6_GRIHO|nr:acetate kinase [Grimontia hollisae]AMG31300.1 acetate kinase [Grimontia hollisae]EEY72545.1 acetate kinase [Grimontia hollisae CIP 101886]MDF2185629.1 acetate kinase [Grimontia hollisae]STO46032.1 Acetate kinase [Grimontia hollisae]STO58131.1 Acetate kinase [Grimontia hollisae]